MKRVFSFFTVTALVLLVSLNGCVQEDPAKPMEIDWSRTATLKGVVMVNSDVTKVSSDQVWRAADITSDNFIVTINYPDLANGATGVYTVPKENIVYTKSDGYTIVAPVGLYGTTIRIKVTDFNGTLLRMVDFESTNLDVVWRSSDQEKAVSNVMGGETRYVQDIMLDGNEFSHYSQILKDGVNYKSAVIYGVIRVYRDLTEPNVFSAPPTANIRVSIPLSHLVNGSKGEYTVPSNQINYSAVDGSFTVKIPIPETGSMNVHIRISDFNWSLKQLDEQTVSVTWKASNLHESLTSVWVSSNDNGRILPAPASPLTIDLRASNVNHWEPR